jgi:hypothetical protein
MKNILTAFCFSTLLLGSTIFICTGQSTFEKIYATDNYDVAQCIEITSDHGFILTGLSGVSMDTCTTDIIVTKCDVNGDIEWSNLYSLPSCEQGYDIKQTADDGYVVAGALVDFDGNKMVLMKLDAGGQIEWQKLFSSNGHDEFNQLFPLDDGGFLVAGYRYNFTTFGYDVTLSRVDATGGAIWTKVYLTAGAEYGLIQIYDNGDDTYFLTCTNFDTNSFPFSENFFLLHVDASGNVLTCRQYGNDDTYEKGWGIIRIEANRYWLVGHSGENGDALLIEVDSTGAVLWAKKYNDGTYAIDESSMTSFLYIPEIGLYICGFDGFYNPYSFILDLGDAFLFKVDDSGDVVWWKDYGDAQQWYWEAFFRIKMASDGNFIMAGGRTVNGNNDDQVGWDMYVVKTNNKGETGCETTMNVNVSDITIPMLDYAVVDSDLVLQETLPDFIVTPAATVSVLCSGLPTGLQSPDRDNPIYLYPNPADGQVAVKSSIPLLSAEMRLYNVLGKEVFYLTDLEKPINISALPSGIYFYTISDKNAVIAQGKLDILRREH